MKTLHLAKGLDLPLETAITQKYCFAGRSGSGKTYGATKLAELMLDAGAQVVVIDLVGVWYGLRVGADGGEGIPVPVLGGQHGDIELDEHGGAIVADLVVDQGLSVVLDVSALDTDTAMRRFVRAFVERFYDRKKQARSPVHIFFEEAQELVPQKASGEISHLVNAMQRLIKIGRNFGIGVTLITQRPQAVSKEVLNQTEAVFVGQMNGKHERDAMEDWIVAQDGDTKLVEELPALEVGTMFVWSPQWLKRFDKVKIVKKRTADVGRTLGFSDGKKVESRKLAPVDLAKLGAAMTKAVEEKKASDPAALKKRISELEKRVYDQRAQLDAHPTVKVERVEVPVLSLEDFMKAEAIADTLMKAADAAHQAANALGAKLDEARVAAKLASNVIAHRDHKPASVVPNSALASAPARPTPRNDTRRPARVSPNPGPATTLGKGERAILTAVAQHGADGVTREQLTVLTGYTKSSRDTYLQRLTAAGLVEKGGVELVATDAGVDELGPDFAPLPTGRALRDYWLDRLSGGERAILQVLVDAYPKAVTREQLSELTEYTKSSRNTYLQRLSARRLVREAGGGMAASNQLFDGGR